jgi:phosphodiesterase/alkaline phosphatase D-like protein
VARRWAVACLVGYAVLAWGVGFPARAGGDVAGSPITRPVEACGLGLVAVGALMARRWPGVAAVVLAVAAAVLAAVATVAYVPVVAFVVAVAFLAPAVALSVASRRAQRPAVAVTALAAVAAVLLATTTTLATALYDRYYGPAHPTSSTPDVPVDRAEWAWSGGVTATAASVVARLDEDAADAGHVELDLRSGRDGTRRDVPGAPDADRIVRFHLGGLAPGTTYTYAVVVDGHRDVGRGVGRFRTPPTGPASLTVAFGSCARTGSDGAVFDAIRAEAPDLYVVDGDLHYGNVTDDDPDDFLGLYDRVLTAPAQAALYRSVPVAYVWDDHDYGANNADAGSPSRDAARRAYRQAVPHHRLSGGADRGPIYQAFTLGRVRFILTDTRSERTDATMLGTRQLAWLLGELRTASPTHALVVWVNPDPWIAPADPGRDDWGGYPEERRRIADAVAEAGTHNLVMLSGDAHMVALDDGTNSDYSTSGGAGFPVLHAAALDRPGRVKGGPYSHGAFPGAGQYGVLTVRDDGGPRVTVGLAGRDWTGRTLVRLSYPVDVPGPAR